MFKAFISYSHAADGRLAPALHKGLHQFAKSLFSLRALHIFRDQTNLSANPALWPSIEQALDQSEYLLLLASPAAAGSKWVRKDLEHWIKKDPGGRRVLIVLTEGTLRWSDVDADFDWTTTDAVPRTLARVFSTEPLYVDLSWARSDADLSLRNVRFRAAVLDLASPLHQRPKDELDGEDIRLLRRASRLKWSAIVTLTVTVIALAIASGFAFYQRNQAISSANAARANALKADKNARETDLRRRAALGLAQLQENPVLALITSADAARDTATELGTLPPDVLFSLASSVQTARESRRAKLNVMPTCLASSPDGDLLAIGSLDLLLIYKKDGRLLVPPIADKDGGGLDINAITFSPDGQLIATGSGMNKRDWSVRIWNRRGQSVAGPLMGHGGPVRAVTFSPDSKLLASASEDGSLRLWARDGSPIGGTVAAHRGSINALAFSTDGRQLFSAGGRPPGPSAPVVTDARYADTVIRQWHVDGTAVISAGRELVTEGSVFALASSPDGRYLASGGGEGLVRIWQVPSGEPAGSGRGHQGAIRALAFDPETRLLASGGDDGRIGTWNMTGDPRSGMLRGHEAPVLGISFDSSGRMLTSISEDATLRSWNLAVPLNRGLWSRNDPDAVALVPGGEAYVTAASGAVTIRNGEGATTLQLAVTQRELEHTSAVAPSTLSGPVALAFEEAGFQKARVLLGRAPASMREILKLEQMPITTLAFSPGGDRLVVGAGLAGAGEAGLDQAFWIFRSDGTSIAGPIRLEKDTPTSIAFSPKGETLLVGDSRGRVHFFDGSGNPARATLTTGSESLNPLSKAVTALAMSPDGKSIAVANGPALIGAFESTLALLDVASGATVATMKGHRMRINTLAFSPDGRILASAGGEPDMGRGQGRRDYAIRLWASPSGEPVAPQWTVHDQPVRGLSFIGGGAELVSLDSTGTFLHWDGHWQAWLVTAKARADSFRRATVSDALRQEAERLLDARKTAEALAAFDKAIAIHPDESDLYWARSQAFRQLRRHKEALADQTAAIERSPFNPLFFFERGKVRAELRDLPGALDDFTEASKLAHLIIRPAPMVAEFLPWTRPLHDTARQLSQIAMADVYLHRARVNAELDRLPAAAADIDHAGRLGLRSVDFYLARARIRRLRGDVEGAGRDEREAATLRASSR